MYYALQRCIEFEFVTQPTGKGFEFLQLVSACRSCFRKERQSASHALRPHLRSLLQAREGENSLHQLFRRQLVRG